MERHLNLVETTYVEVEKRVLPRFPFSYLIFKSKKTTYEVCDISYTGMQLRSRGEAQIPKKGEKVKGTIHWRSASIDISGDLQWVNGDRFGVQFKSSKSFEKDITTFLSIENMIAGMRPVHRDPIGVDVPADLKYWLRADGPVELFVWQHSDGELSRFQLILFNRFVEWQDGVGIKTGRVLSRRDLDTPLSCEDEFEFQMDGAIDLEKIAFGQKVVKAIPTSYLSSSVREFIDVKLA